MLRGGFIMNYTTPDIEVIAVKNNLDVDSSESQKPGSGEDWETD